MILTVINSTKNVQEVKLVADIQTLVIGSNELTRVVSQNNRYCIQEHTVNLDQVIYYLNNMTYDLVFIDMRLPYAKAILGAFASYLPDTVFIGYGIEDEECYIYTSNYLIGVVPPQLSTQAQVAILDKGYNDFYGFAEEEQRPVDYLFEDISKQCLEQMRIMEEIVNSDELTMVEIKYKLKAVIEQKHELISCGTPI